MREPRQVLGLMEDACRMLEEMRASVKPSPQLSKQVSSRHLLALCYV